MADDKPQGNDSDKVNLPPIKVPEPDQFNARDLDFEKRAKEKRKKNKDRKHPTDGYKDVRKKRKGAGGCCAGIGCLGLIVVVILGVAGFFAYPVIEPVKDFARVRLDEATTTISEAPSEATLYFSGGSVTYSAPRTDVPIAIVATEVRISGDYTENVYLCGIKQTKVESGARFLKNLDVYTLDFVNEDADVRGELTGKTLKK